MQEIGWGNFLQTILQDDKKISKRSNEFFVERCGIFTAFWSLLLGK
jgi:hypothetical protein